MAEAVAVVADVVPDVVPDAVVADERHQAECTGAIDVAVANIFLEHVPMMLTAVEKKKRLK